jgi:hypothetical protein
MGGVTIFMLAHSAKYIALQLHDSYHHGYQISQLAIFPVNYRQDHRLAILNIPFQQNVYSMLLWLKFDILSFESFGQISKH